MRRVIILFLFVVFMLDIVALASAQDEWNYGLGLKTCGTWISRRQTGDYYDMVQWMLGYISAAGYYGSFKLKESEANAFSVWIDNYCRANPLEKFIVGVRVLVKELTQK